MNATLLEKIIYWLATALMFFLMGYSIVIYHINHAEIVDFFLYFEYPAYLIYPLAYAKLLALIIILTNIFRNLKDIAYGAYFINMVMATIAHLMIGDNPVHAYVGLVAVPVSYVLSNRVRGEPKRDLFLLSERSA